jgi:SAM-dependent methyltransferase
MADATDYPSNDNSFDIVFFNHVLEHIPNDIGALSEVYRILKPGGLLILGVPNEGALFWQLAYRLQPHVLAASDHVHFYTAKSLKEKCLQAGFKIHEITPIGWGVPHWSLDAKIRTYKFVDDLLERIGKALIPAQATSLYLAASKQDQR